MIVIRILLLELSCKDLPNDLEQTQLQSIASFSAYAQVGEDEEPGVLVRVLGIFEVVQRRDHGARRTPRLAVLLQSQKRCQHRCPPRHRANINHLNTKK